MPSLGRKRGCLIAVVLFVAGGVAGATWMACSGFPFPATSPWRYASFRRLYADEHLDGPLHPSLMALLPLDVPDNASDVRFIYTTPPGDVDLELRCVLPAHEIAALASRAAATATVVAHGSDELRGHRLPDDVQPVFDLGDGPNLGYLPPSFTIYVTGICHSAPDRGSIWIYNSGVAIDPARRIALWWMTGTATAARTASPAPSSRSDRG